MAKIRDLKKFGSAILTRLAWRVGQLTPSMLDGVYVNVGAGTELYFEDRSVWLDGNGRKALIMREDHMTAMEFIHAVRDLLLALA